jgi:hypothetical protein
VPSAATTEPTLAAADLEPDPAELQVEVVVDDDQVGRGDPARLGHQHRVPGRPAADNFGAGTLVRLELRTQPWMTRRFDGAVALVAGASQGIGQGIAIELGRMFAINRAA